MGAGLSKHEDEVKADNLERAAARAQKSLSMSNDDHEAHPIADATIEDEASSSESKCPMKMKDGSYTFDWGAMFRPQFPHGPGGKRPLNEEQAREKMGQPDETTPTTPTTRAAASIEGCPVQHKATPAASSSDDGCPVKHQEYNVYSQPIDPKNNMPQTANQLWGPGQTKDLPTDRVNSSIPKVGCVALRYTVWAAVLSLFVVMKRILHSNKTHISIMFTMLVS
jgi:hypothetical protein